MEPRRRFRFLKELSEGAFGKVYLAEMITGDNFKSVVAIKLLHGKWSGHEEIVRRSRDEARVLGLLHHRNIIRVEDLTSINGQCAIVMEYLDGVDLKTLTSDARNRGSRVPRKVVFEVGAQIGSALDAAYNKQPLQGGAPLRLIHRDIKPSNVMLTVAGDVKVLDFGTAQARFDDREAHTQALAFGSAAYMAPERLLGDPDAPSGDVFSLGITLYEMLAGEGFGKIHIRPERFEAKLEKNLGELDLSDLDETRAEQVRAMMRLLLAYEAERRPTAVQVTELLEALAEEVHDGSIRRFCREVVAPIREAMDPEQDPNDPLTGSTVFEDSSGLQAPSTQTWTDDPGQVSGSRPTAPDTSGVRSQVSAVQEVSAPRPQPPPYRPPDPAEIEVVPVTADPAVAERLSRSAPVLAAPALPSFHPETADLFAAPTMVRTGDDDLDGPTTRMDSGRAEAMIAAAKNVRGDSSQAMSRGDSGANLPADPGGELRAPPPPPSVVTATPTGPSESGVRARPVASTGPALRPGEMGARNVNPETPRPEPVRAEPPRAEAPKAEAPRSEAQRPEMPRPEAPRPEMPRPKANEGQARGPAPKAKPTPDAGSAGKSSGSGGIGKIVALLFVLFLLGGGAVGAAWFFGVFGGKTVTPPPVPASAEHKPTGREGGTVEVGPADGEGRGALVLKVEPAGSATVEIRANKGDYREEWNSSGVLELVGMEAGSYKTKVTPVTGSGHRGVVEVKAGMRCEYTFQAAKNEWTDGSCG